MLEGYFAERSRTQASKLIDALDRCDCRMTPRNWPVYAVGTICWPEEDLRMPRPNLPPLPHRTRSLNWD